MTRCFESSAAALWLDALRAGEEENSVASSSLVLKSSGLEIDKGDERLKNF